MKTTLLHGAALAAVLMAAAPAFAGDTAMQGSAHTGAVIDFTALDANADSVLDNSEFAASGHGESFATADVDKNGSVSKEEYDDFVASQHQ